ncbi:hypothetical protein CV770_24180 [Bradyrhizobium sp. AC87j1]|uniref:glycosyltransferase family 4 protein n=1 Tax=Bradyrhizobium sp. AC87j1 TaxID=2055894 RepID=UPI000CEBFFFE|nr:glycosyltransferase [Bradyrhizobium sp. AC87j1]PPQ16832.1 hypothetical protein CV770_24180 [Bradyrhizobium sp. AC87j1]
MSKRYTIYLWEPETSPHKLPLFYELLRHERVSKVTFIAQKELGKKRQAQGWQTELREDAPIIVGPTPEEIRALVVSSPTDSIHIFSGLRRIPCIVEGLRAVIAHKRRFGILHEPRVFEGLGGIARLAQSWATESSLRRNAAFVLAIGAHGPDWFQMSGYPSKRIFPFAYFLPPPIAAGSSFEVSRSAGPVISFLGRLEKLKGIHLFVEAMNELTHGASVYVAGHGSCSELVLKAEKSLSNLRYLGPIKMNEVPYFLSMTDILVLPSITMDDGWGAVVSEALMAGAAVVTSSKVGASMCLAEETRGAVVNELDSKQFARTIDGMINKELYRPEFRKARSEWAMGHLTQKSGASYLLQIFDHLFEGTPRPASFVQ